jgi:hypothetical protein
MTAAYSRAPVVALGWRSRSLSIKVFLAEVDTRDHHDQKTRLS